jgi:hypothetical protein
LEGYFGSGLVYSKADALPSALEQIVMRKKIIDTKGIPLAVEPVSTKEELTALWNKLMVCYSLPPVHASSLAALGRRSNTSTTIIATVVTAAIILAAGVGEVVIVFGVLGVVGSFI